MAERAAPGSRIIIRLKQHELVPLKNRVMHAQLEVQGGYGKGETQIYLCVCAVSGSKPVHREN